jgi:enamine deaminase RidA (YjgF/YER057c/UK114 family)
MKPTRSLPMSNPATIKIIIFAVVVFTALPLPAAQPGTTSAVIPEYAETYPAYGVSEAVRAGDFLYIGGIVAIDGDGAVVAPNDGAAQVEIVYARIGKILAAHGADFRHVVSETIFVTDNAGAAYPSAAAVEVESLAVDGLVLEVQMVAHLGKPVPMAP